MDKITHPLTHTVTVYESPYEAIESLRDALDDEEPRYRDPVWREIIQEALQDAHEAIGGGWVPEED